MGWISQKITGHKKLIVSLFLILAAVGGLLATMVVKNDSMVDYLPKDSESTIALDLMDREFSGGIPNTRVMVSGVSLTEALDYKHRIQEIPGVTAVLWLDDVIDIRVPLEMADAETVEAYYKAGMALFSVTISAGWEKRAVDAIYALETENDAAAVPEAASGDKGAANAAAASGDKGAANTAAASGDAGAANTAAASGDAGAGKNVAVSGDAANTAYMEAVGNKESLGAFIILVPLIIVILLLTTGSWLEPVLYLLTIGIAIVMNMGLTALTGEISFITLAVSPILQLAVSLDYSIFLLHSFQRERSETGDVVLAMQKAMQSSFSSIAASAATTMFGFLALLFMKFQIGPDMGLNLVKGIMFSYISVMVFLPALTLCCYRLLDKTKHRRFVPELGGVGRILLKIRIPALIVAVLVVVPSFMAQSRNDFIYGSGTPDVKTSYGEDTARIDEVFGQTTSMVVLVPRGDPAREALLCRDLKQLENVTDVTAYVTAVGTAIPPEFLGEAVTKNFYSENYGRIIVTCATAEEGEAAFGLVREVRAAAARYYDTAYTCGQSANLYDMKTVISSDNQVVSLLAIIAIGLTLLVTFRSLTLPVILLVVIESAIWINLAVSYFTGTPLNYIGYLVIHTVQLGATIDYAILFTQGYLRARESLGKREAMTASCNKNILSIIVSVIVLAGAGLCLYLRSTNVVVSTLGMLLCRGTLMSFLLVVCVLPALLLLFDRVIMKTTLKRKSPR